MRLPIRAGWGTAGAVGVGVVAWLWPIGLGGMWPVGGDVTAFSIGLMAELGRALRAGRIPFWNDLWGFGFPGLAESQMGVYYPPHWLLFGGLSVEIASAASLVLHSVWAGLGGSWAARRFGARRWGGVLAGLAFATCGFFLVHRTHQWGATTASWMPWAWGLAWGVGRGEGGRRVPLGLAAVLALQILPGHFQLAFITQVTSVLVGLGGLLTGPSSGRARRATWLAAAMAGAVPLSVAQLAPTYELASLAGETRDVDYLSAFASPPTHLVSYVAPGLFHESPLWRPIAWDAFHAMPEEHLAAVGLVPLFLALVALRVGWRDPAVRTLALVALAATTLSLGPYAPGFASLCGLPGFSFFRAPARWGSAAMLALALLAGRGLDAWPRLAHPGRTLRRFALVAAAGPAMVVGLFELALWANEPTAGRPARPGVAAGLDRAFGLLPWGGEPRLSARVADARRPLDDPRVPVALARQGRPSLDPADRTLSRRRWAIYAQELGPTALALLALVAASTVAGRSPRGFVLILLLIAVAEAGYWSRRRTFDLGPIGPLTEQSPVLGQLAALPRGTRVIDPSRNLAMVAEVAPVESYRTLDLPIHRGLVRLASGPLLRPETHAAIRAVGAGVRVDVEGTGAYPTTSGLGRIDEVTDSALLGWLEGADAIRSLGRRAPARFLIARPEGEPARAWFVSGPVSDLVGVGDDPRDVLAALAGARPIRWRPTRPEEVSIDFDATGPGTVVLTQLDYPRWRASLSGRPASIVRVLGGWQGVSVPGPGRWNLRLVYDARKDRAALGASMAAWGVWGVLLIGWRGRGRSGDDRRGGGGGIGLRGEGADPPAAGASRGQADDGDLAEG